MSVNLSGVTYTYPVPKCFSAAVVSNIADLKASIAGTFNNYATIRNNLLLQLNRVFFGDGEAYYVIPDAEGHISLAKFIENGKAAAEDEALNSAQVAAEAQIASAKEALATAESNLASAKSDLVAAEEALASAKEALATAKAELDEAQKVLAQKEEALNELVILNPQVADLEAQLEQLDPNSIERIPKQMQLYELKTQKTALEAIIGDGVAAQESVVNDKKDAVIAQENVVSDKEDAVTDQESEVLGKEQAVATAKNNLLNAKKAVTELARTRGLHNFVDCDESTAAYKFYGSQIIDEINKLTDYINKARGILVKWDTLTGSDLSALIHSDVVQLECLAKFCDEVHQKFGARYYYDYDEDTWKLDEDDYAQYEVPSKTYEQVDDGYADYDDLYKVKVKCDAKGPKQKTLDCFNEVNLLDRLKYIQVYYAIKEIGYTNYVFPGNKENGFPCVAENGIDDTDARVAQLEKFYLGYLIDRDGPVNAFCSLYEVKVRALQETLNEMQKRIKALNVYLDFVNHGLELLNISQSNGGKYKDGEEEYYQKIPDGVILALTYLCGRNMYNLFEAPNGKKYLVLPEIDDSTREETGNYILVLADESGKKLLIGDAVLGKIPVVFQNQPDYSYRSNGYGFCYKGSGDKQFHWVSIIPTVQPIHVWPTGFENYYVKTDSKLGESKGLYSDGLDGVKYHLASELLSEDTDTTTFKLPKRLDCSAVDPTSVQNYDTADQDKKKKTNKPENDTTPMSESEHQTMIESWTKAFNKKTEYLNNAIELVNTDIEQIRNKINTYQSQATTFRNRVHDVYINTVRKTKL